ncbi:exodeoxyribonuclease III [Candidatus Auribacterota bacterium]
MKVLSWNVNGLRAVYKKGFMDFLGKEDPDVICLQETKARPEQLPGELKQVEGYESYFSCADRPGYSGVAIYSKVKPEKVEKGFGVKKFDNEGRILIAEYKDFVLYNIYFPNGKASKERLQYKMDFYDAFLDHVEGMKKKKKNIVVCGDVNTAHKEIDLARPKENEKVSGFLPEERAWIDKFLGCGYADTLRMFRDEPGLYSWWDMKSRARDRNVGWRIDYFIVSKEFENRVESAYILSDVTGSDHCPIGINIK